MNNKKAKAEKKKPPYSVLQNLKFILSNLWRWDKALIFISLLRIPVNVILPLLGIYMSRYIIEVITGNGNEEQLLLYVLIFSLAMVACNVINNIIMTKIQWKAYNNRIKYMILLNEKYIDADYDIIENPENNTKFSKAFESVQNNSGGTEIITNAVIKTVSSITGFLTYALILFTLNPMIVILLSVISAGNYFAYQALNMWVYRNRDNWTPIDRKLSYIQRSSGDFSNAKDIRLYSIGGWFTSLFKTTLKERMGWETKYNVKRFSADATWQILQFIREGIAYGYLIYRMLIIGMPVADFILYFGIIAGYSHFWLDFVWSIGELKKTSLSLCDLRECLDMPDKSNRGNGIDLPSETCEIEFKNAGYKYPKNENYTIKNLSFKINKGEKIAIVGLNGAGKTTLIKLMCGLYRPAEGEILVGGKNIQEYNRDEYYTLLSAVFQDIYLMPVSISKNIALQGEDKIDKGRIGEVLELSGLSKKVDSLRKGADTLLLKSFAEEAIELSGGERQKLALSRALHKEGKIIVLDEPTAALDPIAESEMYQKYDELTNGRTAVYISHRLSSTRFCDRIFFLEAGEIIETGSHDELMQRGGKYAEMFDIQSHYYKENARRAD